MTDLEPVLDSSNTCSNDMNSKHSGAGANACSRNNMVLITAPPLYELAWSQQNGLSLKYASSSLAKEKSSLWWSAETFDIVISSQHCPYIGEQNDAREFSEHELSSLQLESHIEDKVFDSGTPVGSPRSTCGSSEDMVEMERNDKVVQEKHEEEGACYGQEFSKYPPHINKCQLHDAKHETLFIQEKDFNSGPENCSATTEPSKLKDQISNHEVDPASYHRNSLECSKEFSGKDDCNALAKDATHINKSSASTPEPAADGVLAMDATGRNKTGKMKPLHRNQFCMDGSTTDWNSSAYKMGSGKGPTTSDADDSRSSSNMRGDGLQNIESTSGRRIISIVKRVRIDDSESEKLIGGKRLKRLTNGNCSSTSCRQDNSFMNWVTAITNGLISPRDAHMESSQHSFQHKKGGLSPLPISEKERKDVGVSHGAWGFRSIFKALYHPGYNVGTVDIKCVDNPKEPHALKETDGRKAGHGCAVRERMNLDPHSSLPASSFSFGEGNKEHISNGLVNFGTARIASREDGDAAHNKVLASSNRPNQDICQVEKYPSATMGTCAELMTDNRHIFQTSSWVTRLSRRVSSPETRSLQCSNCLDLSAQKFLNDSMHNLPFLESQTNRANEKPQPHSISHTDSHVSERIVTDKLESKVHLTASSQTCKRSEPMQSTFSRRLDALKQAKPSRFADKDPVRICLFCGMCDHSITECSEVVETKLEDYLKSIPMYDSIKKASCFCILCLKLDHWAAECPNVSSKGNQFLHNESGFGDGNIKSTAVKKNGNQPSTNYDGAMMMRSEGRQDEHQFVHGRSASQRVGDLSNVSSHKNESAGRGSIDLCVNEVDGTTNTDKMKVAAFCSQENELERSEFAPFHNPLSTTIMSEPKGIFVAVRKLRLSRTDILRWMKSSTPHFNLDGFYLRLRLGIPEKGLGGTGYHVACINGACCKTLISVCVGSSTYSVSSRFISNHDFDEDELNAWWFKKLREGSRIPTREELNEKLQLRVKFGF